MAIMVYVDEQEGQARQVLRSAVASAEFTMDEVAKVMPAPCIEDTIQMILELECKVLITDYRLSEHKADVEYSGTDLVLEFQRRFDRFPCFVTTSFPDEAVNEPIDTNIIYPKSDFLSGDEATEGRHVPDLPFFHRVKKKMAEYETFVSATELEWKELLEKNEEQDGLNAADTERLLKLDDILEALQGKHVAVESHVKKKALQSFGRLIEKSELLISKIENELNK